jgi:hypothetical protein
MARAVLWWHAALHGAAHETPASEASMRYLVEKRTAYGRTIYAVLDTLTEQTIARCDYVEFARNIVQALEAVHEKAMAYALERQ